MNFVIRMLTVVLVWAGPVLSPALGPAALPGTSAALAAPAADDSGEQARTLGRGDFLPAFDPPRGAYGAQVARLGDGSDLEYGLGANMSRVDGFSLLAAEGIRNPGFLPTIRAYESYGTVSHRWSGAAEVSIHPFTPSLFLGGRWGDETDVWPWPNPPVTAPENFAAAVLLGEDFYNYLHRRGTTWFAGWRPDDGRELVVSYENVEHDSLRRLRSRIGLFGGHKRVRENPPVANLKWELLRFRGMWAFGPKLDPWEDGNAHTLLTEIQGSPGGDPGTTRFLRLYAEQRGRQRLTPSQFVGYRLAGGWSRELNGGRTPRLPVQWVFRGGGLGSLRGHRILEFAGDRTVLLTFEYGITTAAQFKPVLFVDGGRFWNAGGLRGGDVAFSGEDEMTEFALDGGLGLQIGSGFRSARIDVGRDLRAKQSPARVTVRFGTPY